MLANQLIMQVDKLNDGNATPQTYDRYEEHLNRSAYVGVNHSPSARDMVAFYRTFPTKSGNFKGVAKSALKITRDVEVAGVDSSTTITAPIILDLSFSVPLGASEVTLTELRQLLLAFIDSDSLMDDLNVKLMV